MKCKERPSGNLKRDVTSGIDLERLAKDIDRFNLASEFRRHEKIVFTAEDIPALKRANAADRKRLKGLDGESPDAASLRESIRARAWIVEELTRCEGATVTEYATSMPWKVLDGARGLSALEAHIRANWKIHEIIFFNDFTHGGTYDAGKGWRMSFAGYVADTAEEQRNLIRLFKQLCREAFFFMGMWQRAEMGADVPPAVGWARFGGGGAKSPLAKTLNALIRSIPSKARK